MCKILKALQNYHYMKKKKDVQYPLYVASRDFVFVIICSVSSASVLPFNI